MTNLQYSISTTEGKSISEVMNASRLPEFMQHKSKLSIYRLIINLIKKFIS